MSAGTYVRIGLAGDEVVVDAREYHRLLEQIMRPPEMRETLRLQPVGGQRQPLYLDTRRMDMLMLSTPADRQTWEEFHGDEEESRPREPWEQ